MFIRTALLVLRKDFAIEVRSREILYTTLLFSIACVVIFMIAFVREGIYVGKLLGMVVLMLAVEVVLVPAIAFFFRAWLFASPLTLVVLLVLGTIGFASVGTLFAAMLVRARTRDVMLPILLYPITIPVMIAGVLGTSALMQSPIDEPIATMWITALVAMDTVFLVLALWTFEPLMTE
jgi:ABC-type transport system involved in cytochrome c biogenesis permease component